MQPSTRARSMLGFHTATTAVFAVPPCFSYQSLVGLRGLFPSVCSFTINALPMVAVADADAMDSVIVLRKSAACATLLMFLRIS